MWRPWESSAVNTDDSVFASFMTERKSERKRKTSSPILNINKYSKKGNVSCEMCQEASWRGEMFQYYESSISVQMFMPSDSFSCSMLSSSKFVYTEFISDISDYNQTGIRSSTEKKIISLYRYETSTKHYVNKAVRPFCETCCLTRHITHYTVII